MRNTDDKINVISLLALVLVGRCMMFLVNIVVVVFPHQCMFLLEVIHCHC